jgi:hypothetical protein
VGGKTALPLTVSDPQGEALEYKFFCRGGQISREKDTYYFNAQQPGQHKVELYVVNASHLVSAAEATIQVTK